MGGGFGGPVGGFGAIGNRVIGDLVSAGIDWTKRQVFGTQPAGAPSIPAGGSMPGAGQMGLGSTIGRIGAGAGAAIGTAVARGGKIMRDPKGKIIREVVGGVLGYYVLDKALGWIFKAGNPPPRHMNVLNVRALRRADRRMDGFRKVAKKVLSTQGFKVERRGTGRSCSPKRKCK